MAASPEEYRSLAHRQQKRIITGFFPDRYATSHSELKSGLAMDSLHGSRTFRTQVRDPRVHCINALDVALYPAAAKDYTTSTCTKPVDKCSVDLRNVPQYLAQLSTRLGFKFQRSLCSSPRSSLNRSALGMDDSGNATLSRNAMMS